MRCVHVLVLFSTEKLARLQSLACGELMHVHIPPPRCAEALREAKHSALAHEVELAKAGHYLAQQEFERAIAVFKVRQWRLLCVLRFCCRPRRKPGQEILWVLISGRSRSVSEPLRCSRCGVAACRAVRRMPSFDLSGIYHRPPR